MSTKNVNLHVEVVKDCCDYEYLKGILYHMTDDEYKEKNGNLPSRLEIAFDYAVGKCMKTHQIVEYVLKDNYKDDCYSGFSVETNLVGDVVVISLSYTDKVLPMEKFIITTSDRRKYVVIAEDESNARIKFSKNFPSSKIKSITITGHTVFNIIE